MSKKPTSSQPTSVHRQGTRCGYTLHDDGSITPAPLYVEEFSRITNEREGVDMVLRTITQHCAQICKQLATQQQKLWKDISEDYGIDMIATQMIFDGSRLRVHKRLPKESDSVSAPGGQAK